MFDKDLTIVNKWFNKSTKKSDYIINHVKGFWSSNEGVTLSGVDLVKSDGFRAFILMSEEGYAEPKTFQETGTGWTLQNDDYIVKGIVDNVSSLAKLKDDYECMKITKVSVKDYGSNHMQHFEISGD